MADRREVAFDRRVGELPCGSRIGKVGAQKLVKVQVGMLS